MFPERVAFAISSKLGLPSCIIDDAKKQISQEDESFEDVISTLEENRITIEKERMEIARYKTEVEDLKKQLETKQEKLNQQRGPDPPGSQRAGTCNPP